jgi:hypothetical protein
MRENLPGPGNYNFKSDKTSPGFKFGTDKRGVTPKNDTPGPGQYRLPSSVGYVADYARSSSGFDSNYRYI